MPWNYPIQIGARGVAPALAAGCTVVLKPSSEAPMTALRLGEIALACGLPPGVLNVVPGTGSEAGVALASHPDINQLTFTGSVDVGVQVAKMAAENVVPVVMELGGKSPNIVFADADLDLARAGRRQRDLPERRPDVLGRIAAARRAQAHDALVERLTDAREDDARRTGRERSRHGADHLEAPARDDRTVRRRSASRKAPTVAAGGDASVRCLRSASGYYFQPTLLDRVSPDMRVAQEEIFGPVLAIIDFDDVEEAARVANRSQYGLVAGIWTRDINKAMTLASRIKAGQVYINTYGAGGGVELPFGGYKKSGYGREKGLESLASYTQVKNVCVKFA